MSTPNEQQMLDLSDVVHRGAGNKRRRRELTGVEAWPTITTLEAFGIPAVDEVRALPALEHLVVHQPESLPQPAERRQRLPGGHITT